MWLWWCCFLFLIKIFSLRSSGEGSCSSGSRGCVVRGMSSIFSPKYFRQYSAILAWTSRFKTQVKIQSRVFKTNLLLWIAMIFKAKDEGVLASLESTFSNGLDDLLCWQIVDHGVPVSDVGFLLTIPEVKFNTSENGEFCISIGSNISGTKQRQIASSG